LRAFSSSIFVGREGPAGAEAIAASKPQWEHILCLWLSILVCSVREMAVKRSSKLAAHKNGRMLLVRRRKDGKWTLPGGKRKKSEAPQRSLMRELKEELPNVDVKNPKRWRKVRRNPGGDGKKKDQQIFTARKVSGHLTIGDTREIDRAGWCKPGKVKLTGVALYARNRLRG
jgi:ADP-ribose pyrophosphatase YjhB (NUDIX family)